MLNIFRKRVEDGVIGISAFRIPLPSGDFLIHNPEDPPDVCILRTPEGDYSTRVRVDFMKLVTGNKKYAIKVGNRIKTRSKLHVMLVNIISKK